MLLKVMEKMKSKFSNLWLLCITLLFFSGCANEVNLSLIQPKIAIENQHLSVYDTQNERIVFYYFFMQDGKMMEEVWAKTVPMQVEFMALWMSGLGHDLRRITGGKAESIQDALMFGASEKGMISLHVNKNDYLLDNQFASDMVHIIRVYESKIVRYERDYDKYPPRFLKKF